MDHPELEYGMDGKAVLPVTCQHCGYVATYSVKHLESVSPWE
jgi:predicted nucleic-acid-binding Zn-ribbon protein